MTCTSCGGYDVLVLNDGHWSRRMFYDSQTEKLIGVCDCGDVMLPGGPCQEPSRDLRGELTQIVLGVPWLMEILHCVRRTAPSGSYVAAGAIRSTVWDFLHGRVTAAHHTDVDVVYFADEVRSQEQEHAERLKRAMPQYTTRAVSSPSAGPFAGRSSPSSLDGPGEPALDTASMSSQRRIAGALGELATFKREHFAHEGFAYDVYRKGHGPAVLVLTEMPGISPQVLGFAEHVVAIGCTAVLPDLFGTAGRDPLKGTTGQRLAYGLGSMLRACVSHEFTVFATGRSSPVVNYLRALGAREHARCGGPGIGVVGMCFTGGFALAMAPDPHVLVPVLSQPSLPVGFDAAHKRSIDCSEEQLDAVARRCARKELQVIGLRFKGDPLVPAERFAFLRERLGDAFIAVELDQADGHPAGPLARHHSVLTVDLIDEPGEPTRAALDQVLHLLKRKLRPDSSNGHASS